MNLQSIRQAVSEAARYLRRLARCVRRGSSRDELRQMDERGLRDLGIGRGEIPYWMRPGVADERGVRRLAGEDCATPGAG